MTAEIDGRSAADVDVAGARDPDVRAKDDDRYPGSAGCEQINFFAFNEWTEGGYLEPDSRFGYGKLEAVKAVFRRG